MLCSRILTNPKMIVKAVIILLMVATVVQLAAIRGRTGGNKASDDTHDNQEALLESLKLEQDIDTNHKLPIRKENVDSELQDKGNDENQESHRIDEDGRIHVLVRHDQIVPNEEVIQKAVEEDENEEEGHVGEDEAAMQKPDDNVLEKPDNVEKPENGENVNEEAHDMQIEEPKAKEDINIKEPKDQEESDERDENQDEDEDDDEEEEEEDEDFHARLPMKPLSLRELQPPDHMDAVRMEQDGHLNRDYRKEIILGNHEEFDAQPNFDPDSVLSQIFDKVDSNRDHFITLPELEEWIVSKVKEHFSESNSEAERIFRHLDVQNKGHISWQDFHIHFLMAKGYDLQQARKHAEDYETISLNPDEKERLIRYKFRWAEADMEPQDNQLTIDEFKAFRHPEQSQSMLDRMVQDIIDNLDQNNNGIVTEEEFVALPPGELDGAFIESDKIWQEERRKEFRNVIDINHDGKLTRLELKNYVDPQNPNHARLEAENLIQLADEDKDDKLSLEEVLENAELFLGSKMVDTGRNFHDEF